MLLRLLFLLNAIEIAAVGRILRYYIYSRHVLLF